MKKRGPEIYPKHEPAKATETRAQTLQRMARNAKHRHFHVLYRDVVGCWHVSSPMNRLVPYRVTRTRCECPGFQRNGVCPHLAVLLDHLGELPEPIPFPVPGDVEPLAA